MDWFRSWHGAPTDNKWLVIARKANVAPGIVSAVAWALMDYASQNEDRGSVAGFDIETYATFSGFSDADVQATIEAMRAKGIIEDDRLSAWEKRQPKREDNSIERVKAWRTRNAPERSETQSPTDVTQCNAEKRTVTQCDAPDKIRVDTDIHTPSECGASAPTADAGPTAHATSPLDECIAYLHEPKANKPGAIGRIFAIRYGARYPPDYARLGAMAKRLSGGYIALAEMIWRSTVPEGDPHDYLSGAINGTAARRTHDRHSNGTNGQDAQPVGSVETREALERAAKQLDEWIAGGSAGQADGLLPGGSPVAPDVGGA